MASIDVIRGTGVCMATSPEAQADHIISNCVRTVAFSPPEQRTSNGKESLEPFLQQPELEGFQEKYTMWRWCNPVANCLEFVAQARFGASGFHKDGRSRSDQ